MIANSQRTRRFASMFLIAPSGRWKSGKASFTADASRSLSRPSPPPSNLLPARLAESHHELVGVTADRGVEYLARAGIRGIGQALRLAVILETCRPDLLANHGLIDPVRGVGARKPRARRCGVIQNDIDATGAQR